MKIYFFDVPTSDLVKEAESEEYDILSEKLINPLNKWSNTEADKKWPYDGPYVDYFDYKQLMIENQKLKNLLDTE